MRTETEFANCTFPDGTTGSLFVKDGMIISADDASTVRACRDMRGLQVFPGAIDTHVHFRDFEWAHKETWETGCKAALRGGVTTVFDMPNNKVPITTAALFEEKVLRVGKRPIDYRLYFGATGTTEAVNTSQLAVVARRTELAGLKIYNGSSTGSLLVCDPREVRAHLQACKEYGVLPCIHAESEAVIKTNRELLRDPRVCDHCFIRDTQVEVTAVREMLALAAEVEVGVYFCHISTPEALELILRAREAGQVAHIEVCPHHLYLDREYVMGTRGAFFKMNPPLRSAEQTHRMIDYVCTRDIVDCIGSDHAPHTVEEKGAAGYDAVPSGVPGVQTLVPLMYNFVRDGRLDPVELIKLTSANAAHIFGLPKKGGLTPGHDADFFFLDPRSLSTITHEDQMSKCGWTPFEGMRACFPLFTVAKGVIYAWRT